MDRFGESLTRVMYGDGESGETPPTRKEGMSQFVSSGEGVEVNIQMVTYGVNLNVRTLDKQGMSVDSATFHISVGEGDTVEELAQTLMTVITGARLWDSRR